MPSTIAASSKIGVASTWAGQAGHATANALYAVVSTGSALRVYKSADGTTWTEQDSADAPSMSADLPYSSCMSGVYIYTVRFTATNTTRVRRFNTSTDQWETTDIGTDVSTVCGNAHSVFCCVRSDGDVIVLFRGSGTNDASYSRYEGVSWSGAVVVHATNTSYPVGIAIDGSDRSYFFFIEETTTDDLTYRTLNSANTLGTTTDLDTSQHDLSPRFRQVVRYNDGTNNRVGLLTRDSTGEIDYHHGIEGDTLTSPVEVTGVSTSTAPAVTSVGAAVFNSKVYAIWDVGGDATWDASDDLATPAFGSDTVLIDLAADTMPQFVAGLSGLGVVYQDGTSVKFEWLVAPPTTGFPFSRMERSAVHIRR